VKRIYFSFFFFPPPLSRLARTTECRNTLRGGK
jgi:hypothetical protein